MITDIVLPLPSGPGNPRNSEGSFVTLANGDILFAYSRYTGVSWSDHARADIASRVSTDGGKTWSTDDRILVANEGDCNVMSVSFLRLQDGRIALFYVRKNSFFDCRMRMRSSSDEGQTWSEPVLGNPSEGYLVTNNDRIIQLASGRLICPSAIHVNPPLAEGEEPKFNQHGDALFSVSDDAGKTWRETPQRIAISSEIDSGLQEPGIIQRSDGSLYGYARTSAGQQWEFTSTDEGETWSEATPSRFISPTSPLSIKAIHGNSWLAVWNDLDSPFKVELGKAQESSWGRTPLALAISTDEGATWSKSELIEDDPVRGFCYIAIHSLEDAVLLSYCSGGRGNAVLQETTVRRIPLNKLILE